MLEHLVERGIALDGLTFGEARRHDQEVSTTASTAPAHGVVGAGAGREMTLPDDLDDLVLGTVVPR